MFFVVNKNISKEVSYWLWKYESIFQKYSLFNENGLFASKLWNFRSDILIVQRNMTNPEVYDATGWKTAPPGTAGPGLARWTLGPNILTYIYIHSYIYSLLKTFFRVEAF